MRFDIPVIGMRSLKVFRKAGVTALAIEANRTILLEREKIVAAADKMNLAIISVTPPPS
jgi:UDP-2,3-diacylglucosamine hydrolase